MRKLKRDYTFALSLARIDYRKEKEFLALFLSLPLSLSLIHSADHK
jgi:hypothetical protein